MRILLFDADRPTSRYLSRIWTPFSVRTGMLSTVERLRKVAIGVQLFYFHPIAKYEELSSEALGVHSAREHLAPSLEAVSDVEVEYFGNLCDDFISSESLSASTIIKSLGEKIILDYQDYAPKVNNILKFSKLDVIGAPNDLSIHESAEILPNCVFDVRDGPISISKNAKISPFTYVKGPTVICSDTFVDNCKITGPTVIGKKCRVGGEIEASIIGNFSNKHHEGFLGHSIIGSWVNIGALATTSDLKNNYGTVKLLTPTRFQPTQGEMVETSTGSLKFGSIISDCVKIGIAMKLKTGSVVDVGSSLFGSEVAKYTPPFSWGDERSTYDLQRFLSDCATIFARRGEMITPVFAETVSFLWNGRVRHLV